MAARRPRGFFPALAAIVWWRDATFFGDEITERDDERIELVRGISAGMVVKVTREFIVLAHDQWEEGDFRSMQAIPRSQIVKVQWIRL